MDEQTERLKKYAVRIKSGNDFIGSGILWKSWQDDSHLLYVFTAAHVVKEQENIKVEFWYNNEKQVVNANQVIISEEYKYSGDSKDIALIELEYDYENFDLYRLADIELDTVKSCLNNGLQLVGFPFYSTIEKSFILSVDTMECDYCGYDHSIETIKYKFNSFYIDNSDKNSEFEGFSGGGIFAWNENELYLIGVHNSGVGTNIAQGNLLGTSANYIIEMCKSHNIDVCTPYKINGNLSDRKDYFKEEVLAELDCEDYYAMSKIFTELLQLDLTETIEGIFCQFCNECEFQEDFHRCNFFRGFLLILCVFLRAVDDSISLKQPRITKMNNVPIYFICSEGRGNVNNDEQLQLKLQHFVYALKTEKDLSYRLENDCIIIWGSKKQPRDDQRKCGIKMYRKVLRDITMVSTGDIDIAMVNNEPQPRGIIHINEILNMLRKGQLKQIQNNFLKYLEEL